MLKYSNIAMRQLVAGLVFVLASIACNALWADEVERRRVEISLSIFPRVVAVDNQFNDKLLESKKAHLLFVCEADKALAQALAERMQKTTDNIGGVPLETQVVSVSEGLPLSDLPTAIFVVEKLNTAQLEEVLSYARQHQRLVFSPFVGDVERGVTVGIFVGSRVQPYFNLAMLRQSKVSVNALLMKMSKHYD
jgi:hypothetical protein